MAATHRGSVMLADAQKPMSIDKTNLRAAAAFLLSVSASAPAGAQYAAVGPSDSGALILGAPWVILILAMVWAKLARNYEYRLELLQCTLMTVVFFVASMVVLVIANVGLHEFVGEGIAVFAWFAILFSGPIVLIISTTAFLVSIRRLRASSVKR